MSSDNEILSMKFKICDYVKYEIDKDKIVTVFEKQDHKIQRFFRSLKFNIPMYKKITFDKYCSEVFTQIDGTKTVKDIGEKLEDKFGEEVSPLYERLLVFLNYIYVDCKYIDKVK